MRENDSDGHRLLTAYTQAELATKGRRREEAAAIEAELEKAATERQ